MRLKRLFAVVIILLLGLSACAPSSPSPTPWTELSPLLSSLDGVPAGTLYATAAPAYEKLSPLTPALIEALYVREDGYLATEGRLEAAAIYLSSRRPYLEVAVLDCYGSADTGALADMCRRRVALLQKGLSLAEDSYYLSVCGRRVVFAVGEDAALCQRIGEKLS